jgi:hypothetical protein
MMTILTILSVVAYGLGLFLLIRIAPDLIKRAYDDALFIPIAAVAIVGAMLVFGAIGLTFAIFNGAPAVRGFDAFLLVVLIAVALRIGTSALRPRYGIGIGTYRISRILTGVFFLILVLTALYVLIALFVPV